MQRYERNLGTIGKSGQKKLKKSTVIITGIGGLGGYVLESIARIGVGTIIAIDNDVFTESNLNRQLLSLPSNLGYSKVAVAQKRIAEINHAINFKGFANRFEDVAIDVFKSADLVFDCLDSFSARKRLAIICKTAGVTLIHGAIAGWCGQVGVIPKESLILETICAFREKGIEQELGNLSFVAGFTGNLMVAKAIDVLLGEENIKPSLTFFDLKNSDFENIEF